MTSTPDHTAPAPIVAGAPLTVTGDALGLTQQLGPDGRPVGVLTIGAAAGLIACHVRIDAQAIDALIDGLTKLRRDIPSGGLVAAAGDDLARFGRPRG